MKKLFIIKVGITFENTLKEYGDFDKWVVDVLDNPKLNISVIDIHNGDKLPNEKECLGVIITGSHSMVTDELDWSLNIQKWIPKLVKANIPILGICYGHQLLAKSMKGLSGYHKSGMEIGTVDVNLTEDGAKDKLFSHIDESFKAHTIHSQTVLNLPQNSVILASNKHDKHHAFRIGKNVWGVQFHPEFNEGVMKSYIKEVSKDKIFDKVIYNELLSQVEKTTYASKVLTNFGLLLSDNSFSIK